MRQDAEQTGAESMLFIFGTRTVVEDRDDGHFHCPHCRGKRQYVRKQIQRYVTFFFFKVMPADALGEYLECQDCKQHFTPEALRQDPITQANLDMDRGVKFVLYRMAMADGDLADEQVPAIQNAYKDITDSELSEIDVRAETTQFVADEVRLQISLACVAPHLDENKRESLIRAALQVATAAGAIGTEQRKALDELASMLKMTPAHIRGILSEFE